MEDRTLTPVSFDLVKKDFSLALQTLQSYESTKTSFDEFVAILSQEPYEWFTVIDDWGHTLAVKWDFDADTQFYCPVRGWSIG